MSSPFARWFQRNSTTADKESEQQPSLDMATADTVPALDDMSALDNAIHSDAQAPDTVIGEVELEPVNQGLVSFPLLGKATPANHLRKLFIILVIGLVLLIGVSLWMMRQSDRSSNQLAATGQALMQSQRLAKSISYATAGTTSAFAEVQDSAASLASNVRALANGDDSLNVAALGSSYSSDMEPILALVNRAEASAKVVLGQKETLTQVGEALKAINLQSSALLEVAETIASLKLQQGASPAEISAAGQLVMLTQRIGKSANEFQTSEGVSSEAVFLLGKDMNAFKEIAESLLKGNSALRLPAASDGQIKTQLQNLLVLYEETRTKASAILSNLQGLASAKVAQKDINTDSEPLRTGLQDLQAKLQASAGVGPVELLALLLAGLLVIFSGIGISRVQLIDSRARQADAERKQQESLMQEQEAKRLNDANQAAILRLMNELQSVAEGDLTQEATVTEDITGAIADSVNYTVEELRALVGSVQKTATRVAQTTALVDVNSTELLAASVEQLREIRETGESVLDMATRINEVSVQAQESANVAHQSLHAADSGLKAVQNAIGGMNSIRDQIQDTSKRIKRLGESSQEIGEITELISDITEQTNVLALNAAIQAASAGEAGRGFSVVAEEVQRLAERSADATRQIAALVKAIQTDTQDAVAAMERSTQGVVEGARLSDSAGTALTEIDKVSRRLAELIEQISSSTQKEAELANGVADNIQHIFAVTEQTGAGTRTTAQQVRELSHMAQELRQSVSRFKIA